MFQSFPFGIGDENGVEYYERVIEMPSRFKNRPPLGFEELSGVSDQTVELTRESPDAVEYSVK